MKGEQSEQRWRVPEGGSLYRERWPLPPIHEGRVALRHVDESLLDGHLGLAPTCHTMNVKRVQNADLGSGKPEA